MTTLKKESSAMGHRKHTYSHQTKKVYMDEKNNCSICHQTIQEHINICATKCGHKFHHTCILQWLTANKICPVCKGNTRPFNYYIPSGKQVDTTVTDMKLRFQKERDREKNRNNTIALTK